MAWVEPLVIVIFACLVIAYLWGHKRGETVGHKLGMLYGPLEVRRQSLLSGQCQICGSRPTGPSICEDDMTEQTLDFAKIHSGENDYICIDLFRHHYELDWPAIARRITHQHLGVGADGLVLIMPSPETTYSDAKIRIFAVDGSERSYGDEALASAARYLFDYGLISTASMRIETRDGIYPVAVYTDGSVTHLAQDHVYMSIPATFAISGKVNLRQLMKTSTVLVNSRSTGEMEEEVAHANSETDPTTATLYLCADQPKHCKSKS